MAKSNGELTNYIYRGGMFSPYVGPTANVASQVSHEYVSETASPRVFFPQHDHHISNRKVPIEQDAERQPEDDEMAAPTREEYDAKLAAAEARLEGRLVGIEGKLDRLFDRVEVSIDQSRDAKDAAVKAREAASATKWNILFTALGSIAVLLAAWAIWQQGIEMVGAIYNAVFGITPPKA